VSKGEGCDRHIEVFKTDSVQPSDTNKLNSVNDDASFSANVIPTPVSSTVNVTSKTASSGRVWEVDNTEMSSSGEHTRHSCRAVSDTTGVVERVGSDDVTETAGVHDNCSSSESTLLCPNCGLQIPQTNYELHALHCKTADAKVASKKNRQQTSKKVTVFCFYLFIFMVSTNKISANTSCVVTVLCFHTFQLVLHSSYKTVIIDRHFFTPEQGKGECLNWLEVQGPVLVRCSVLGTYCTLQTPLTKNYIIVCS